MKLIKILAISAAMALAFALAGCGSGTQTIKGDGFSFEVPASWGAPMYFEGIYFEDMFESPLYVSVSESSSEYDPSYFEEMVAIENMTSSSGVTTFNIEVGSFNSRPCVSYFEKLLETKPDTQEIVSEEYSYWYSFLLDDYTSVTMRFSLAGEDDTAGLSQAEKICASIKIV